MSDHNVIAVSFPEQSKGFQAFSDLKGAGLEGRVEVRAAAVVTRDEYGRLSVPEGGDAAAGDAMWGGGLVGLLVGVLGGPIGMLFGWTGGMLVGSAFDASRGDRAESVLNGISSMIPPNGNALVAEVEEFTPEVVDSAMSKLGGIVVRRPVDEVLDELEIAEEAYEQAEKEARRVAREHRKSERRENHEERKAALKEKLGLS